MGSQYIKSMELSLLEDSVKIEELESQVASLTSEIAMLREKVKKLEAANGRLRFELDQLKEPTLRDAQAEFAAGAWDAFNWIGDRRYNRTITPEHLMQLWKEGRGK